MTPIAPSNDNKILDFDLETLAAGFADPNWVPQKITVASWSWIGSDRIDTVITDKDGFFNRQLRVSRLMPLVEAIHEADAVTGHNLFRFDLPVLNAELVRAGYPHLPSIRVQDTMRLPKSKGLKKSQDDLSIMVGGRIKKKTMNWEEWDRAYEEDGWQEIIARCETDILQHKEMRRALIERGHLRRPSYWRPI